jgi:hypothetical protein
MAAVNGLLVDLRNMPREILEIAFAKGMIRQTRNRRDGFPDPRQPRDSGTAAARLWRVWIRRSASQRGGKSQDRLPSERTTGFYPLWNSSQTAEWQMLAERRPATIGW